MPFISLPGHPRLQTNRIGQVEISLFRRFEFLGDIADIEKVTSTQEEAVRLTPDGHPSRPGVLNNLGNSLFIRFDRVGDLVDINTSISILEEGCLVTSSF